MSVNLDIFVIKFMTSRVKRSEEAEGSMRSATIEQYV